jgi:hypothetical protein
MGEQYREKGENKEVRERRENRTRLDHKPRVSQSKG